ncbi:hypothetical protein DFJ73DRAFT_623359 [Zopfochytrium polystomum]|nr:hypothetical protein DFJ73DRAFT_623359 [Zopfochytrium polystomum]
MASVRPNGTPKIQPLVFQDFLKSDGRVLLFSGATRNTELMGVVKLTQSHEISWIMPKTRETFIFTGRLFIVCAPTLSHRFGSVPRNVSTPADRESIGSSFSSISTTAAQDEFWESTRMTIWRRLSPTLRATWTWPSSGEHKGPGPSSTEWSAYRDITTVKPSGPVVSTGFKYLKMDALDDEAMAGAPSKGKGSADEEYRYAHNAALDNFCLLVFKASRVDHATPGNASSPPTRMVYSSNKDGAWLYEEVNP